MASGGAGNDFLFGSDRKDALFGGEGNDLLSGGGGDDYIAGDIECTGRWRWIRGGQYD